MDNGRTWREEDFDLSDHVYTSKPEIENAIEDAEDLIGIYSYFHAYKMLKLVYEYMSITQTQVPSAYQNVFNHEFWDLFDE